MKPLPMLLTVDEAAELLRTTRRAIYAMVKRGQLPGVVRIRRRVLVRAADCYTGSTRSARHRRRSDGDERDSTTIPGWRLGGGRDQPAAKRLAMARAEQGTKSVRLKPDPTYVEACWRRRIVDPLSPFVDVIELAGSTGLEPAASGVTGIRLQHLSASAASLIWMRRSPGGKLRSCLRARPTGGICRFRPKP